jgi:sulfite reductase (NADPH) hemoprotein beta-component
MDDSPSFDTIDRSRDVSQPVENLGPDERLKKGSDQLRGTIAASLLDRITGAVTPMDQKLLKFHGIYQQDDRDIRDERRRQKLEPAFAFMVRVRLPGGVCTPQQWLAIDEIARLYGNDSLRMTSRQTFQFHYILKRDMRATMLRLHDVGLDTIAACGDDSRGVMCSVNPRLSRVHAQVYALAKQSSNHAIPKTGAYREVWYGEERTATSGPEEPFYGQTYMPRKFKIGYVIPPSNDIDVYAQDLGFITIADAGSVEGFNVVIGGGMGRTDQAPETYPRLASLIGFIPAQGLVATIDAVMGTQRDFGDRLDRGHARFKYTIDEKGLDWVKAEIERRQGFRFEEARPVAFTTNGDDMGWVQGEDGSEHYTLYVENGRLLNHVDAPLMAALREIARQHTGHFRLTPNQNLTIPDVSAAIKTMIEGYVADGTFPDIRNQSALRMNAVSCVALPTCGLAMAESERYLPSLITKIEALLSQHGLDGEDIKIRMSGCPNGCSRPYIAEIGLTGRAPGKYNLYLGGGYHGQRLNKMYRENIGEAAILEALNEVIARFAAERFPGERFGDFAIRAGFVAEVTEGRYFND